MLQKIKFQVNLALSTFYSSNNPEKCTIDSKKKTYKCTVCVCVWHLQEKGYQATSETETSSEASYLG